MFGPLIEADALKQMTSYERCNYLADRAKARKKAEHAEWVKDNGEIRVGEGPIEIGTTTTYVDGSDNGTRSTYNGSDMFSTTILIRMTEILAELHMLGKWYYDDELTIVRAEPSGQKLRACVGCIKWHKPNIHHPEREFVRNKKRLHGLGYYCPACRQRIADRVFYPGQKRGAA